MVVQVRATLLVAVMSTLASSWLVSTVYAQPASDPYIAPVQTQLDTARAERLELLAPRAYARTSELLQTLQADVKAGKKQDRLQKESAETQKQLALARQHATRAKSVLDTMIKAYDDAVTAQAPQLAGESWSKANERFKQAIGRIEADDEQDARRKGAEAEVLLRDAELIAIKGTVLNEVRAALAKAQQAKVAETAPRTLALAQKLTDDADKLIATSRYELAEPRRFAEQAAYEVRHATMLAEQITLAQSKDGLKQQTSEQQWLALEQPLRDLAGEMDASIRFDGGYLAALEQLRNKARQSQQELTTLRRTVSDRDEQLAESNAELRKLETQLGGASEERLALQKRLSAQDRLRDNVGKIESMFTADEGRVYRQAGNLVMSLNAIGFRSGKSTIEPSSFPVLAKVGDALKLFPNAVLTVEGHTDNQGSDSANLLLSQDRADAVRQYLISNLGVDAEKVTSIGYGKARPIANNDNESGRARNRRIDIVMTIEGG